MNPAVLELSDSWLQIAAAMTKKVQKANEVEAKGWFKISAADEYKVLVG